MEAVMRSNQEITEMRDRLERLALQCDPVFMNSSGLPALATLRWVCDQSRSDQEIPGLWGTGAVV